MTILCNDNTYVIYYTDSRKGTIQIPKKSLLMAEAGLDVTLVGKNRLNYGQAFDENILHLLENFSVPEDPAFIGSPDSTKTTGTLLENPIEGQLWYNSTQKRLFVFSGAWLPLANNDDYGGASGVIAHGQTIPAPVSAITGTAFSMDDCSWNVSPYYFPDQLDYMECFTDQTGLVTIQYKLHGSNTLTPGFANYQIIGIKNNRNHGQTP